MRPTPQYMWLTTNTIKEIIAGNLIADSKKKQQKMTHFHRKKMRLETTFCEFWGMYELDFSRLSIFHQL